MSENLDTNPELSRDVIHFRHLHIGDERVWKGVIYRALCTMEGIIKDMLSKKRSGARPASQYWLLEEVRRIPTPGSVPADLAEIGDTSPRPGD